MNVYLPNVDDLLGPLLTGTVKAQFVSADYVPDLHHTFLTDVGVGTRIGPAFELVDKAVGDGIFSVTSPITVTGLVGGDTITGLVVFRDTGTEATSRLVSYQDRRADTVPLLVATDGKDIVLDWPNGGQVLKL